jgi:hypothetical protein
MTAFHPWAYDPESRAVYVDDGAGCPVVAWLSDDLTPDRAHETGRAIAAAHVQAARPVRRDVPPRSVLASVGPAESRHLAPDRCGRRVCGLAIRHFDDRTLSMIHPTKYGSGVVWRDRNRAVTSVWVDGYDTPAEARAAALETAIEGGWTPPRWWQWWRWEEPVRRAGGR